MKNSIRTIVAILICAVPGVAAADPIVFENAYQDGSHVAGGSWCSGCGTMWRVWYNFTLSDDTEITQIDARVDFGGSPSIEYSIWTPDRTTLLFSQILSEHELNINTFSGSMESDLIARISGLQLTAGDYALSIWDLAYEGSFFAWFSTSYSGHGYAYQSILSDGTGHLGGGTNQEMAFRLHGHAVAVAVAVPEPGTLALLGLGLAGIGYSRRQKAGSPKYGVTTNR